MKTYKINEIFQSLQGEGANTGTLMTFIRFSGCNLKCPFCDTKHDTFKEMTGEEILQEIRKYNSRNICLTGGEPLLQVDQKLLKAIINYQPCTKIHIETNGTIIPSKKVSDYISWITVSPKENWKLKTGGELKVIWNGQTDEELEPYLLQSNFRHYYLQPEYGYFHQYYQDEIYSERFDQLIKVLEEQPTWKISMQMQRILHFR